MIPKLVIIISNRAFYSCSGFSGELNLSEGIIEIGVSALSSCLGFSESLTILKSVIRIYNIAFSFCSGFTGELNLPEGITEIRDSAFYECSGFTRNINIPKTMNFIAPKLFFNCSYFNGKIIVPKDIIYIGKGSFSGYTQIQRMKFEGIIEPIFKEDSFSSVFPEKVIVFNEYQDKTFGGFQIIRNSSFYQQTQDFTSGLKGIYSSMIK